MVEVNLIKNKIIEILRVKGPSLPIQIAKELSMNSLFVSAFLSELAHEKRVKISSLKVGGSPLYLLEGQEQMLEKFYSFLHPKESEAFVMLKEKKILRDNEQEPAIRVALRSIKDFAFLFKNNEENYWRYLNVSEDEVRSIIDGKVKKTIEKEVEKIKESEDIDKSAKIDMAIKDEKIEVDKPVKIKERVKKPKEAKKEEVIFQNPLAKVPEPVKQKPKSEFALKVIKFLEDNDFRLVEEKDSKTREFLCVSQIKTALGPIAFLTLAKDKKIISDADLGKLLSEAQAIPLPALILYTGELSKKAKEYSDKYYSILKAKRIE